MGVRRMLIQTVGNWCSTVEDCHTIEFTDKRGNCEQGINYRAEVLESEVCDCGMGGFAMMKLIFCSLSTTKLKITHVRLWHSRVYSLFSDL